MPGTPTAVSALPAQCSKGASGMGLGDRQHA